MIDAAAAEAKPGYGSARNQRGPGRRHIAVDELSLRDLSGHRNVDSDLGRAVLTGHPDLDAPIRFVPAPESRCRRHVGTDPDWGFWVCYDPIEFDGIRNQRSQHLYPHSQALDRIHWLAIYISRSGAICRPANARAQRTITPRQTEGPLTTAPRRARTDNVAASDQFGIKNRLQIGRIQNALGPCVNRLDVGGQNALAPSDG